MADSNYLQVPPSTVYSGIESSAKSQEIRVPISKNFSFIPPDSWKITNPFVLQWVSNIPTEVHREQPLEPVHFQPPKHSLETSDQEEGQHGDNDHRDKRARRVSVLSRRSSLQAPSTTTSTFSRGIMSRVASACQRVIHPNKRQDILHGFTIPDSFPPIDRPFVTTMALSTQSTGAYEDNLLQVHVKTKYEMFAKTVMVDGQEVELELWDTCGDISLHQLKMISYLAWDAVFLCFSVDNHARFAEAQIQWIEEIRENCHNAPIILLGLKKDKRVGSGMWAPTYRQLQAHIYATKDSADFSTMRAVKYIECSAKTGENVNRVFEEGVRMVLCGREEEEEELSQVQKKHENRDSVSFAKLMCFK
ncbi:ras family-domain-containing protein [Hypomontagnella monticulosa]|nr:ras family-domain-containing protein [Hypomontagnella monticulosa]